MGLKEIQEQFVKLSVDKETREKVFDTDSKLGGNFNDQKLSLNRHAFSLIRKRLGAVQ